MIRGSPNLKPQNLHMAVFSVCCCSLIVNVSSAIAPTYPICGKTFPILYSPWNSKKLVLHGIVWKYPNIFHGLSAYFPIQNSFLMLGRYAKKQTHPVVSRPKTPQPRPVPAWLRRSSCCRRDWPNWPAGGPSAHWSKLPHNVALGWIELKSSIRGGVKVLDCQGVCVCVLYIYIHIYIYIMYNIYIYLYN